MNLNFLATNFIFCFYKYMGIIENYKEYRKNKPQYKDWADKRAQEEAKRINYLKKNNITPDKFESDIKRAKTVLNAVDVMDEYSQSRAEEMEMTVQTAQSGVMQLSNYASLGLAALSLLSKNIREAADNLFANKKFSPLLLIPALLYIVPVIGTAIFFSIFSAKQETKASRLGRAEAINKKLTSPKQFAILTDEQNKQVEEIAKGINITKKDVKKENKTTNGAGILNSIKTLFTHNKENEAKIKELNEQFNNDVNNVNSNKELTKEQIEEAKKDKQLVQNVIEKIDIASQEYAEDVELATSTVSVLALGTGGGIGALTKFILNKMKIPANKSNMISIITGAVIGFAGAIWAASVQKQASRVARYKVKQDFLSNPEKLVYVNDELIKNDADIEIQKNKKPNFFKFLIQVFKDNSEYKKYKKEHDIEQLKLSKAREQIEITPEQEKRAKQLQNNVFKMFNKVDEKSQTYSESTEAIGEIVQSVGSLLAMIPGLFGYTKNLMNKNFKGSIISMAVAMLPPIILNIIVTKEQKSASKVADMLAINEMDNYKYFADYSDSVTLSNSKVSNKKPTFEQFKNKTNSKQML